MSIDGEFITTLLENVTPKTFEVAGKTYSSEALHNLPLPTEPPFPTVKLETLDSLVDYIKSNRDGQFEADSCQILCGHAVVQLFGKPQGENRRRDILVDVHSGAQGYSFGSFFDLEQFRIQLLTQFEPTPDRDKILQFIAKVTDEHVKTSQDDGVSQTVNVRVGIATVASQTVPSPVLLRPIRTFIEFEQPGGQFLFRMQSGKELPQAALFEIHTNWKREAAVLVKDYLAAKLEATILA